MVSHTSLPLNDRSTCRRVSTDRGCWVAGLLLAAWVMACPAAGSSSLPVTLPIDFNRDIQPILSDKCYTCHGPDEKERKGKLRLDTREGAFRLKDGIAAIIPGKSGESELVRRLVTADPEDKMPPPKSNRQLTAQQIEMLQRWIDQGAGWARHWAYETPHRPTSPSVRDHSWVRNSIDTFVAQRLEREGLLPSPAADARTLMRRATLDLTGLPPTPDEVDAFLRDDAPNAYERLVDRLLASPRYGERMAWPWLEAARYADSNGYQGDGERTMWPWRDWVIDALNRDLPFDQFTRWQLAGDLLPQPTFEQRLATGFLRNHMINGEGGRIPEENRIDYLFDQTETVATVWLGSTFNCTRCHDHKFDPFTTRDYFGLLAYFNHTQVDGSGGDPQAPPNLEAPSAKQVTQRLALEAKLSEAVGIIQELEAEMFVRPEGRPVDENSIARGLPAEILSFLKIAPERRDVGQIEKLAAYWKEGHSAYSQRLSEHRTALEERDRLVRSIPRIMVMADAPQSSSRDTFILVRGTYSQPSSKVSSAVPASLPSLPASAPNNRLGLAQWLVAPENPLTARVVVNRYWQTLFGLGLVKTAEDFGVQGERPSHPELLDWLSSEFVESGWKVKHLLRLIVTSATYRQSSKVTPLLLERDPENRLLARGPRFRLPSWMIRDAALNAAGLLVERLGGPAVKPYQPTGIWEEATFGAKRYEQDHGESLYRRSLYVFWRRIVAPTLFFDVASRQTCTVKTPRTNVPLHALLTLNDTTYVEAARALAQRILQSPAGTTAERVTVAYQLVLSRHPSAAEQSLLEAAFTRHHGAFEEDPASAKKLLAIGESLRDERIDPIEHAAWTVVCSTILNLDEALTKE